MIETYIDALELGSPVPVYGFLDKPLGTAAIVVAPEGMENAGDIGQEDEWNFTMTFTAKFYFLKLAEGTAILRHVLKIARGEAWEVQSVDFEQDEDSSQYYVTITMLDTFAFDDTP